jgi:site-specific recombinase XerD
VLDELTRRAVAAWLTETAEPSTVGTRLRGMRRFCRWPVTDGELEVAPTDGIEIPAPPEKPVPIVTDDETTALLKACAVPRGRAGGFDRTVVLSRRSTPCRSSRSAARASQRSVRSRAETSDSEKTFRSRSSGSVPS